MQVAESNEKRLRCLHLLQPRGPIGTSLRALEYEMQRYAKPWFRRRAADLFRDETDLAANPDLWGSIASRLSEARVLDIPCLNRSKELQVDAQRTMLLAIRWNMR